MSGRARDFAFNSIASIFHLFRGDQMPIGPDPLIGPDQFFKSGNISVSEHIAPIRLSFTTLSYLYGTRGSKFPVVSVSPQKLFYFGAVIK
jgi:hypothetical protein